MFFMLAISEWLLFAHTDFLGLASKYLSKSGGSAPCLIYKIGFKSGNQNEIDIYFEPDDDLD